MVKKVHVTKSYYRARIRSPTVCAKLSFRIKTLSKRKGIKAVVCCPIRKFKRGRCQIGTIIQSVLYDKAKFTKAQAERHAKKSF